MDSVEKKMFKLTDVLEALNYTGQVIVRQGAKSTSLMIVSESTPASEVEQMSYFIKKAKVTTASAIREYVEKNGDVLVAESYIKSDEVGTPWLVITVI